MSYMENNNNINNEEANRVFLNNAMSIISNRLYELNCQVNIGGVRSSATVECAVLKEIQSNLNIYCDSLE